MISISRGPEPSQLQDARHRHLPAAILARERNKGSLPANHPFGGYEVARAHLFQAQYEKCAFCERLMGEQELPTEHFRPKDGAQRVPGVARTAGAGHWDADCYWWLAWTWENLFFACKTCNGASHKGNFFPLQGAPLPVLEFDLSLENQSIVDPGRENPLDHIRWTPLNPALPWQDWEWTPKAIGPKGGSTIHTFGFLKQDILVQVTRVLQKEIVPRAMAIDGLVVNGRVQQALGDWRGLQANTMYDGAMFLGAKWSALEYLRSMGSLRLGTLPPPPAPGRLGPWQVPAGLPLAPPGIPHAAWIRLLAHEEEDQILLLILQRASLTVKELWGLLGTAGQRFRPTKPQLLARLESMRVAGQVSSVGGKYKAL